jgi:hypothetical protein
MAIELKGLLREQVTNLLPEGLISLCWHADQLNFAAEHARGLSQTGFHPLRISTSVRASENNYLLGGGTIPNQIRESTYHRSANVTMY